MGLAVYTENQVHDDRSYAGSETGRQFTRVVAATKPGSLLSGTDAYGDTMFNLVQLNRIETELDEILGRHPELAADIAGLRVLFEAVRRKRGYVWISGD